MPDIAVTDFKGLRNDRGKKFVSPEYLFSVQNINYDDIVGGNKILSPLETCDFHSTANIDGIYEYVYLDQNNIEQYQSISVSNGAIYKDFDTGVPTLIKSGLTPGKCDFTLLNSRLFITNGKNYPLIYDGQYIWEMGAPKASVKLVLGNLIGEYYYAVTFVTTGGEEYLGTVSNTILPNGNQVELDVPIGYSGTTARKVYRTEADGTTLKLLTTISDNDTTQYIDNTLDGSLGADIIPVNNECPKPYFLETSNFRLVGLVSDDYPTQAWVGGDSIEVLDLANYIDVSGAGDDFTPLMGMAQDYSNVIVGSQKNIYILDTSTEVPSVTLTRSNVGLLNGYSIVKVPMDGNFTGGVMFLSTLNDVRLFNGNFAQPVPTSLDNLSAGNLSQVIKPTLDFLISPSANIFSAFFDYKYHLMIDSTILIFDIRVGAWGLYKIETVSYSPSYNVLGIFNNTLYGGRSGTSVIEQFYALIQYRNEDLVAVIQSPQLFVDETVKYFTNFYFYFVVSDGTEIEVQVVLNGDFENPIQTILDLNDGAYDSQYFFQEDFETTENEEDYRVFRINRDARWIEFKITVLRGMFYFRGFKIQYAENSNKE